MATEKSYAELFSDNGQHCNIWAKDQRQYYETLISNLFSLLGTITNAKSKLGVYLSTTYKSFAQITSRKKASHTSRRKKENALKAKNRKRKRGESAIVSLILQLVDE